MWSLRQAALGYLAIILAGMAQANSDGQLAPARRHISPGLAVPTKVARLQVRQGPQGGDNGDAAQAAQREAQQQIQQLSQSFSARLAQITQQASQSLSQFQQSIQQVQQSVQSVQRSADSAIASVRSSADSQVQQAGSSASSAISSAQSAASASAASAPSAAACPSCASCAACPAVSDAQAPPAATVTASITVTATVTVGSASSESQTPAAAGAAAALPAQSCVVDSDQANAKQAEQQPTMGFDTCTTAGKALAIVGLVLGVVGLSALGFVLWNMRRRHSLSSRPESPSSDNGVSGPLGLEATKPKGGVIERWRNGFGLEPAGGSRPESPMDDYGDSKEARPTRARAPLKSSISKPIRLSIFPNFWRRNSDRLSFQDIGVPSLPVTSNNNGRKYYS